MPRFNRNRDQNPNQNHSQGRSFPVQDDINSIPFYNARLFSMYESLIQSYTHFTYHSNYMYNVLAQTLNGTRESINSNPYPWLIIPNPMHQRPESQSPSRQPPPPSRQPPPPSRQPPPPSQLPQQPRQPPPPARQPPSQQPRQPPPQHEPNQNLSAAIETNIINALFGMMNLPAERRLTPDQLNECIETVTFGSIVRPINNVCSITHDAFEPNHQVSRIRQCGHIFNPDSLTQWLQINNTCPTCRHNLLTERRAASQAGQGERATTNAPTNAPTNTRTIPLDSEININSLYNELLRNGSNIPGFELNSVNDDSVVFSFDLINPNTRDIDEVD